MESSKFFVSLEKSLKPFGSKRCFILVFTDSSGSEREIRKHIHHFVRLKRYFEEELSFENVPDIPVSDKLDSVDDSVREFLIFMVNVLTKEKPSLLGDAEIQHFLHSSVPHPDTWDAPESHPKSRKVVVDITVSGASVVSSDASVAGSPSAFFAVVCLEMGQSRYCTKTVSSPTGNPIWNEEVTLTVQSSASYFFVSVLSMGGALGTPLFVGMARLPVFPCMSSEGFEGYVDLLDVRLPDAPCCGKIMLTVTAVHVGSRGHLAPSRGIAVAELPLRLETGDMLFFRTSKVTSMLTRFFTWSDYDHVGVVIGGKKLRLLEAASDCGVSLRSLDQVLQLYKGLCSEIAVRRVRLKRSKALQEEALAYAQQVRGTPYNWNVIDMITTSTAEKPSSSSSMFCSQVVAALLKKIGVLDQSVFPDNYLPGTLCSENLKLAEGVEADPLLKFSSLDGDSHMPEYPFVEKVGTKQRTEFPFENHPAILNASWKELPKGIAVNVVGIADFGFLKIESGAEVPSAFVDIIDTSKEGNK